MAKFENLPNKITDLTTEWNGHSGMEVEDFISREIETVDNGTIISGSYEDEILKLKKKDGSTIDINVTVQEPTYSYGIYIYGLRIDGGSPILRDLNLQTIQYVDSKTYELGLAIYATADTSSRYDRVGPFPVKIKYGDGLEVTYSVQNIPYTYFLLDDTGKVSGLNIGEDEDVNKIVKWINVKDIFTRSQENSSIIATLVNDRPTTSVLTDTFTTPITVQIISLSYTGDIVVNSNVLTFTLNGANSSAYMLEAYNLDGLITIDTSQPNLNCPLKPGANKIIARAINKLNSTIMTNWVYVDVISTVNCNETVAVINGVTNGIKNNSIATLYTLTVYSPNLEDLEIITYLSESDPGSGLVNPSVSELLKLQIITALDYKDNIYKTSYYKYIENRNTLATNRYLIVKIGGEFYGFTELEYGGTIGTTYFKVMPISAVNYDYCYYDIGVSKSFDLLTGYINNVFITDTYSSAIGKPANVNPKLEVSDGWYEDKGVVYFLASALENPVVTLDDLNLGDNFTLELGIKTYNISDESKPILKLGRLELRPTMLCWDVDMNTENAQATFDSRNAIFQEGVRTHIMVTVKRNFTIRKGETYYPDYLGSFQSTFDDNMSSTVLTSNKFNLVRVLIDDVIDREFIITDDELSELKTSSLVINPTTSDVNFYLLRIYNLTALDFDLILKNYISYLSNDVDNPNDDPKKVFYDKNDILGSDGEISFTKSYKKYNSIVIVFPQDPVDPTRTNYIPSRAWGGKDNSDPHPNDNLPTTLFINYANETTNKLYGGRITNTRIRGQGTSAMRYFIWNVTTHMTKGLKYVKGEDGQLDLSLTEKVDSKFTSYSNLVEGTNKFAKDSPPTEKKGYKMPPYNGRLSSGDIKVKKAVGKVNYASSMQSHKIGFCKLYDDFYQSKRGALPTGGRKGVLQEPFLYFYWYTNVYDVSKIELADLLAADAGTSEYGGKLKFMGFQTWGSAKADDLTYGYDEDLTPGYLLLEGGENGDIAVNFKCPWLELLRNPIKWEDISDPLLAPNQGLEDYPQISYTDSLEKPWENLWVSGDEAIIYDPGTADVTGAWDVNYGLEEVEDEASKASLGFRLAVGTDEKPNKYLRQSVKTFREFYDFVYTHDYNIVETNNSDPATWTDKSLKYCCTASNCDASNSHRARDVYRYNKLLEKWIPAGVKYDTTRNTWTAFNLVDDVGDSSINTIAKAKAFLKEEVINKLPWNGNDALNSGTLDAVDAAIHLAMIRFTSGTDNRAKNTYFRVTGPLLTEQETKITDEVTGDVTTEKSFVEPADYSTNPRKYHYIGFMLDDTDTLLATDNNGLQTKQYNLLEPSYRWSDKGFWGDSGTNSFFYIFDQCFESEINNWLSLLIDYAFENPDVNNKSNKFYQYFFSVLDGYPAIAYNHTAKIYYELGLLILDTLSIENFASNDLQPIQQSHGSCINSEKNFMSKRLIFLGSLAKNGTIGGMKKLSVNPGAGTGTGIKPIKIKMEFSPYIDMYPLFSYTGIDYIYDNKQTKDPIALRYLTEAGKDYTTIIDRVADSNNNNISLINYYKKITFTGLQSSSLGDVAYDRAVEFKIDNDLAGSEYAESHFTDSATIPKFPVVEDFTLANMTLPDTFDASQFTKLKNLNLSKTTTKYVIFPNTGRLLTVVLPETIETFRIYNNPGLRNIVFEGLNNLKTIYIDCNNVGNFDVANFCEELINCNGLQSVTIRNANLYITEEALTQIIRSTCSLTGDFHIINSTDENTTLKEISFATKLMLVNKFGNISDPNSEIRIHFQSAEILDFNCASEVSVYYQTGESGTITRLNLFDITVPSGNDVEIKSGTNPFNPEVDGYLDITYSMSGVSSDIATINELTGDITLKKESNDTARVTINMKVANRSIPINHIVEVNFAWKAPNLGDFAYADGTFTSSFDPTKTLVGLVYAKDATTETSGTVYIIGKEYNTDSKNPYYLGYSNEGVENSNDYMLSLLYQVLAFLNRRDISISNYDVVSGTASPTLINNINVDTYDVLVNTSFAGESDTAQYVNHVNTKLLPTLCKNDTCRPCRPYIRVNQLSSGDLEYYIDSIEDLNNLCKVINTILTNTSNGDVMSCLLYPYFYSMNLYLPTVKENEVLHQAYKKGNWYAPSVAEFSRIIYYRGYSAKGRDFNESDMVRDQISTSIANGGRVLTTPIFSMALSRIGVNQFPSVWSEVVGSGTTNAGVNNITTSINTSATNNYSYQRIHSNDWQDTNSDNKWIVGARNDSSGWYLNEPYNNAWRLTKHQGIPFTKFNYSKRDK